MAFTYLTNLAVNGQEPLVLKDYGFFASFALPTIAFILGITVFCAAATATTKPPEAPWSPISRTVARRRRSGAGARSSAG